MPQPLVQSYTPDQVDLARAKLGLQDPYYLSSQILHVENANPERPERELRPVYDYWKKERPPHFAPPVKWLRYGSFPRYTAKTVTCLIYLIQRVLVNPNLQIVIFCRLKDDAEERIDLIMKWLENPELTRLYGTFKKPGSWSKVDGITVSQRTVHSLNPTFRPVGLETPLAGKRCDMVLWDDLLDHTNNHMAGIINVQEGVRAMLFLLKPGGEGIYLCTRYGESDPATDGYTANGDPGILRRWRVDRSWDAPEPNGYFGATAKPGDEKFFPYAKPGEWLFPSVWNDITVDNARKTENQRWVASQVFNDPIPESGRYFELENYQYFDLFDENQVMDPRIERCPKYLGVDPASALDSITKGDETAMCVMGIEWVGGDPLGYVIEWVGGIWKAPKAAAHFMHLVTRWRPKKIFIETNFGGGWLLHTLTEKAREVETFLPIQEVPKTRTTGGKERIQILENPYSYRRIWHSRHLKGCKGEEQLVRYTPEGTGHDDWPDAEAMIWQEVTKKRRGTNKSFIVGSMAPPVIYKRPGV